MTEQSSSSPALVTTAFIPTPTSSNGQSRGRSVKRLSSTHEGSGIQWCSSFSNRGAQARVSLHGKKSYAAEARLPSHRWILYHVTDYTLFKSVLLENACLIQFSKGYESNPSSSHNRLSSASTKRQPKPRVSRESSLRGNLRHGQVLVPGILRLPAVLYVSDA